MEQIKQLREMRDAAQKRIEDALAAIQNSADAKLVNSLTALIKDLEQAVGSSAASFSDKDATEAVEGGKMESASSSFKIDSKGSDSKSDNGAASSASASSKDDDDKSKFGTKSDSGKAPFTKKDEMSLEDSLEAELLNS